MAELWTDAELQACVEAYAKLLREQPNAASVPKKDMLDRLQTGPLKSRTKGSIEYRMANISAVMEEHGREWLRGYVPARNVGPTNSSKIAKMLKAEGLI
ncbi:hypothetical protein [Sphingomonas jatrophae]|uniref:5-methylcytosine-specific restriction enzyme A n=1 Tax=Sphingomonas jatrophae TaxID=1166337 RepID=A0A1I6M3K4_9SPHN|nr:hypothetical protein [Sphingomonas jatrophae]SFS10112.1 5-methylcytosine-specific restriction enzyme A [Sphingomonas jatrophae]